MEPAIVQERSMAQSEGVVMDGMLQQTTSSVDWYEIIKILILAALFVVIVPKPKFRLKIQQED